MISSKTEFTNSRFKVLEISEIGELRRAKTSCRLWILELHRDVADNDLVVEVLVHRSIVLILNRPLRCSSRSKLWKLMWYFCSKESPGPTNTIRRLLQNR